MAKLISVKLVSVESCDGIDLVSLLFAKYKCSNLVKAETNSGTVPVSKLVYKYNSVRLVSVESCDGIDLVRLFVSNVK